jgi:hypothetical protein
MRPEQPATWAARSIKRSLVFSWNILRGLVVKVVISNKRDKLVPVMRLTTLASNDVIKSMRAR